jgi:hypothetical protein
MKISPPTFLRYCTKGLKIGLFVGASLYLIVYVWLALHKRLSYPYELEWMEGGSVCHVERILNGQSLYCPPSLDFVPYIYTPFYFYVSAVLSHVFGRGFFPLRLLSIISSLGCVLLIAQMVRKRSNSRYCGYIAACFFIASFRVTGAWFDIARIDTFFLFLLIAAINVFQSKNPIFHSFVSAVLLFLSFFTKQAAVFIAFPLSLWSLFFRRGFWRFAFPLIFVSLLIISTFFMNKISEGWYSYYVFNLPRQHPLEWQMLSVYWTYDILRYVGIACAFCVLCLFIGLSKSQWGDVCFDLFILGSMLLASCFFRLHSGHYANVLFPAYAAVAIYFGIGLSWALSKFEPRSIVIPTVLVAATLQFFYFLYRTHEQIPMGSAKRTGDGLLKVLAGTKGDVFLPGHPWYPVMIGKRPFAQTMAIDDVLRATNSTNAILQLKTSILRAISEEKFGTVILDHKDDFPAGSTEFNDHYVLVNEEVTSTDFTPVTGWGVRPTFMYQRKKDVQRGDGTTIGSKDGSHATRL